MSKCFHINVENRVFLVKQGLFWVLIPHVYDEIVSFHYFFPNCYCFLLHNRLTQTDTDTQSDIYSIYSTFYPPCAAVNRAEDPDRNCFRLQVETSTGEETVYGRLRFEVSGLV